MGQTVVPELARKIAQPGQVFEQLHRIVRIRAQLSLNQRIADPTVPPWRKDRLKAGAVLFQ
ncbi:hypothetical protein FJY69_08600 [candidate division WOR-3 bacterium]|nr:hypothetical protein [candidate division WOR-3 bacterium]